MKKFLSILLSLLLIFALAACSKTESGEPKQDEKKSEEGKTAEEPSAQAGALDYTALNGNIEAIIASSVSVDEYAGKGDEPIKIGKGEDIVPGVYDFEILEGKGNIMVDRVDFYDVSINFIGDAKSDDQSYLSKFRLILLEGDELTVPDINKFKLTAVKDFSPMTQLAIGNYIVGKDVAPGKYKLSTNVELDPQYEVLGWDVEIYDPKADDSFETALNPKQSDTVIDLKEGEIITVDYNSIITQEGLHADDAVLILTPQ